MVAPVPPPRMGETQVAGRFARAVCMARQTSPRAHYIAARTRRMALAARYIRKQDWKMEQYGRPQPSPDVEDAISLRDYLFRVGLHVPRNSRGRARSSA